MIFKAAVAVGIGGCVAVATSVALLPFREHLAHAVFAVGAGVALLGILGIMTAPMKGRTDGN